MFQIIESGIPFSKIVNRHTNSDLLQVIEGAKYRIDWWILILSVISNTKQSCGITPVRVTEIGPVKPPSEALRSKWLDKVKRARVKVSLIVLHSAIIDCESVIDSIRDVPLWIPHHFP